VQRAISGRQQAAAAAAAGREEQAAAAAPAPQEAAADLSAAARSLRTAATRLDNDKSLTAKQAKLVRQNAKRFPLIAREIAAGRMRPQKLAVESEADMIRLGREERELQPDAGEQEFTERRAAPVDTAEAIEVATHSIPGLVPGSRVWQRPRFAEISFA